MWCHRVQCALALLSIALAVLSVGSAPTDNRYREILQTPLAQDHLEDTMAQLLRVVADADNEAVEVDASEAEAPAEHKAPLKFQHRPLGMRLRKNCKHFFWKTYTLC